MPNKSWFAPFRFTRKSIIILLCLAAVAGGVLILLFVSNGARVTATFPRAGQEISAWGQVGITFSQSMRPGDVESRFKVEPAISGKFRWENNTLWFVPQQLWQPGVVYQARLAAGASTSSGRMLLQETAIHFRVRQPEILFLSTVGSRYELMAISPRGGSPRPLTASEGKVYDFAPSRDGEQVVYSVQNTSRGSDLWLVQRDGSKNYVLVECGADRCSQPAWHPDGTQIVYFRQTAAGSGREALTGVWSVSPQTGKTSYLFPGSYPSISPDGRQLALVDGPAGVIRVLNIETGKGVELMAATEQQLAWFPDGSKMIYAELQPLGDLAVAGLFQVDLKSNMTTRILNNLPEDIEAGIPSIAQDGQKMALGLRAAGGGAPQQVWLIGVDGSGAQPVDNNPLMSQGSCSWDPWGSAVVFQESEIGVAEPSPRVMEWERSTGTVRLVAENAALPEWLP